MTNNMSNRKKNIVSLRNWHKFAILILYDIIMSNGAYFLALWLRFDCKYQDVSPEYIDALLYADIYFGGRRSFLDCAPLPQYVAFCQLS